MNRPILKRLIATTSQVSKLSGRFSTRSTCSQKEKLSYFQGPSETPLLGITIGQGLEQRVDLNPDKEAVIFSTGNVRKTFGQLLEETDQLAAGLLELGIKRGDRVGIWGPNSIEWILTQYATARAGIILVNINPLYRPDELQYALEKVGCTAVIMAEEFKGQNYYDNLFQLVPELARTDNDGHIKSHLLPDLKRVIMMGDKKYQGALKFSEVMEAATSKRRTELLDLQSKLQFDDPINIQFTSGTTGTPKGATLSHHNIMNNSYFTGRRLGYHEMETRICIPVPLYHCFGMVIGSLQMVTNGSTCVFPSPAFESGATLHSVSKERCTSLYGVPTMFIDMLNHHDFDKFDLKSLYTGVMAGSPCPIETMRQVISQMNMPSVTVCYGTTENSPVTFQSYRDDVLEKKVSTVGRSHPHVETKIVDENGDILPVGESGELCTRGYMTMLEYWNDPTKTKEVIKSDRWYFTGDIGEMDEDGFCRIVGRIKDMIIRGGENVYPLELEQILYKHPDVKDVQVVGIPDDRLGEEIFAFIQIKDDHSCSEEDIIKYCKEKMARYKIPRFVKFVTEFPLTVTGKVQKFKLQEIAELDVQS
ncbi:ACSF2 [Mytilus edulis]|uniref:Medium-chain acyl-CoA ligase ACSF2, mitochondrial n=1 Tax=Mytilus edulis TaxID=6550 RepID=A0A8S3V004_MYTED|nr:ACSF2 [Mytilus edulis]